MTGGHADELVVVGRERPSIGLPIRSMSCSISVRDDPWCPLFRLVPRTRDGPGLGRADVTVLAVGADAPVHPANPVRCHYFRRAPTCRRSLCRHRRYRRRQGTAGTGTFDIDATSGPSDENPTGHVSFDLAIGAILSNVTHVCVNGNEAVITGVAQAGSTAISPGWGVAVHVRDNGVQPTQPPDLLRLGWSWQGSSFRPAHSSTWSLERASPKATSPSLTGSQGSASPASSSPSTTPP